MRAAVENVAGGRHDDAHQRIVGSVLKVVAIVGPLRQAVELRPRYHVRIAGSYGRVRAHRAWFGPRPDVTAGRAPNLKLERDLLVADRVAVAGCDEVGRGSLGGPVSVGMVVVDAVTRRPPTGLRDSKLLPPAAREALVPRINSWSSCWAIGHASAAEIDEIGILRALGWKSWNILLLIQNEAGVLGLVGGLLGICVGWGALRLLSVLPQTASVVSASVSPLHLLEALGIAIFSGLVAGAVPAWRGAHLSPVEALRHD